jgi:hypothetical protein
MKNLKLYEDFSVNEGVTHRKLVLYHGVKDPKNVTSPRSRPTGTTTTRCLL